MVTRLDIVVRRLQVDLKIWISRPGPRNGWPPLPDMQETYVENSEAAGQRLGDIAAVTLRRIPVASGSPLPDLPMRVRCFSAGMDGPGAYSARTGTCWTTAGLRLVTNHGERRAG